MAAINEIREETFQDLIQQADAEEARHVDLNEAQELNCMFQLDYFMRCICKYHDDIKDTCCMRSHSESIQ
jgi:hypothetical protein